MELGRYNGVTFSAAMTFPGARLDMPYQVPSTKYATADGAPELRFDEYLASLIPEGPVHTKLRQSYNTLLGQYRELNAFRSFITGALEVASSANPFASED